MISAPGIGSGLDVSSIVDQILELERLPIIQLEAKRANNDIKISTYAQVKTDLSAIQTALTTLATVESYSKFSAVSSDTDVFTATAATGAAAGTYDINVTNLAVAHRIEQQFTDETEVVGTGTLNFTIGSNSFTVDIDSSNDEVAQIRDAINNEADNTDVTASIITDDAGAHLVLTSNNTGVANQIDVQITNDGDSDNTDNAGLSQLMFRLSGTDSMNEMDPGEDATFDVEGFSFTRASNSVNDAIAGVTLELKSQAQATLTVSPNYSGIESALSSLTSAYNTLISNLTVSKATVLQGDSFTLGLERQLRDAFSQTFSGLGANLESIFDLGLSFDKDGVLSFDSAELDTALAADPAAVQNLFIQNGSGFAESFNSILDGYLGSDGMLESKTDSIALNSDTLDDRIELLSRNLLLTEQRLLNQFTALDTLMAQLNTTSAFLDQQLTPLLNSFVNSQNS